MVGQAPLEQHLFPSGLRAGHLDGVPAPPAWLGSSEAPLEGSFSAEDSHGDISI